MSIKNKIKSFSDAIISRPNFIKINDIPRLKMRKRSSIDYNIQLIEQKIENNQKS